MSAQASGSTFINVHRNTLIAVAVLVFHVLAIWALQAGLLLRAVERVVPVEVLAQIIELPRPIQPKVEPLSPAPPEPVKKPLTKPEPVTQAPPKLLAIEDATPTANTPAPQAIAPATPYTPAAPVVAIVATSASSAKLVLPSSMGDYLNNPKPAYPAMSKRLGEQGSVNLRIYVGADGLPQKRELLKTSGFERLDQAALDVVMRWTFVPGKRGGVPEAMWMVTTIKFELE